MDCRHRPKPQSLSAELNLIAARAERTQIKTDAAASAVPGMIQNARGAYLEFVCLCIGELMHVTLSRISVTDTGVIFRAPVQLRYSFQRGNG
jgi:hypothetical protein